MPIGKGRYSLNKAISSPEEEPTKCFSRRIESSLLIHPPVVPPQGQGVEDQNYEVSQDEVWNAVDEEERRKYQELRNSKEWQERERHILKIEDGKKAIGQRAKEIAQGRGFTPARCDAVEDAAKYVVDDLNNPKSEAWERIDEEVKGSDRKDSRN
ncbi:glycerol-3-phosphate acyltransferase 1 [Striga asiatica]|uniref:Glycerol-3-phosphate acyltransferase 1 n=1 Tax=Striga asiatica TaxID=4170 RepID=A0A5A7QJV4_STRAF|nr:glycerol-3-phosphate acyltransferase 1 [Striga asiatica]